MARIADPDGFVHEVGESGCGDDDVALPLSGEFFEFVGDGAEPFFVLLGVACGEIVEVSAHFVGQVEMDVEQTFDFEPMSAVLP